MRKILICLSVLLLAVPLTMDAKKPQKKYPFKYDVRVGVSGFPLVADLMSNDSYLVGPEPDEVYNSPLDYMYSVYDGSTYTTGNITAEFNFLLRRWFTLSLGVSFQDTYNKVFDPVTGQLPGTEHQSTFTFLPQARFSWINTNYVRMYSSLGFGVTVGPEDITPIIQLSPLGVEAGKKVYGFAELGVGLHFIGGYAGVGFRF